MLIEVRRRARMLLVMGTLAIATTPLFAHDLFLKLSSYFLPPNTLVRAILLNGTFAKSESAVTRERVADVALIGPSGRETLDTAVLSAHHDTTDLHFRTGEPGTYVLGVSVRPRDIALTGEQFNAYLKEEGIEDVLAERTRAGMLAEPAKERYAKHVKAIFQVGNVRTDTYNTLLGYGAELVPLENPYSVKRGGTLRVRCLINGQAIAGLTVLAGGVTSKGAAIHETRGRSDADGIAEVRLRSAGRWYVKFIRMQRSTAPGINYESQWATLTFEVR